MHAADLGLDRARDTEILSRAKETERTVITADLDYPRLLAVARTAAPGLILFRGGNWNEAAVLRRLDEIVNGLVEQDIARSILAVEPGRLRRRWLPIA